MAGENDQNGTQTDWREALPEPLRSDPTVTSYKSLEEFVRGAIETKSYVGRSIRPPGPDATKEARKEFVDKLLAVEPSLIYAPDGDDTAVSRMWKRLGKPEKPEDYEIPEVVKEAGLDEGELRSLFSAVGLTKAQARQQAELMARGALEQKRLAALDRVALETEWGAAKEERTLAAKAAALKMGLTEPEVEGMTPRQLRAFYSVAKAVGVNQGEFRSQTGASDLLDPAEAKRRMDEIRADPDYFDAYKNPARHRELVSKMSKLSEMAYR